MGVRQSWRAEAGCNPVRLCVNRFESYGTHQRTYGTAEARSREFSLALFPTVTKNREHVTRCSWYNGPTLEKTMGSRSSRRSAEDDWVSSAAQKPVKAQPEIDDGPYDMKIDLQRGLVVEELDTIPAELMEYFEGT